MTSMKGPAIDRTITWDEENRVTKTLDRRDETLYAYDDGGIRAIKRGKYGETLYAGENLSIRNGTIESKHIFAGNARVVTKVTNRGKEAGTYYYHGDHLASSNSITTRTGSVHENIEYFPYGETWVHKLLAKAESLPFKFTGKEYDPETGWYYFGARYFDARLSRWTAVDPALDKYFPNPNDFDTEHDYFWYLQQDASAKLPGIGGVFNSINLDMYHYAGQNPVKLVDPDGEAAFVPVLIAAIVFVLSDLSPLNDNEHHSLFYSEKNGTSGTSRSNMADNVVGFSAEMATDTIKGKIQTGRDVNRVIKQNHQVKKQLLEKGEHTMRKSLALDKQTNKNIHTLKMKAPKPTILGKVLGKGITALSFIKSYFDSTRECNRQGKEWSSYVKDK